MCQGGNGEISLVSLTFGISGLLVLVEEVAGYSFGMEERDNLLCAVERSAERKTIVTEMCRKWP